MKTLIFAFLFLCSMNISFAQSGWQVQYSAGDSTFAEFYDIYFLNDNTGWAVDTSLRGILLKTTNRGTSWTRISMKDFHSGTGISFYNEFTGWICGSSGQLYKSTNGGINWARVSGSNCNCDPGDDFIDIQFINQNTGWAYGDMRILKTTNGGMTYATLTSSIFVWSGMFLDPMNGWIAGYQGTEKTTDGGLSWNLSSPSVSNSYHGIYFINSLTGWTCNYTGKIFKSTDGGSNWNEQQSGIRSPLNKIQFLNENTGWIVGDSSVILKTSNGGSNWFRQSSIAQNNLNGIFMLNSEEGWISGFKYIFHTTDGGGPAVGIEPISSIIPEKFSLWQNYPNPFNPTTKINYDIPVGVGRDLSVQLKVYDAIGNEVETLVNEKQNAGSYSVSFNAGNYPSGVYFYKIVTESFSETKKMVLLK